MGVDVFIVHGAPDKDTALRLRKALSDLGVTAFVDKPDIPPGAPWDETLDRELRSSLLQVVLLGDGKRWYPSEEIRIAIDEMCAHGSRDRVVPVLLKDRQKLPYGLGRAQALDWEGPSSVAARLRDKVAALRGARIVDGKPVAAQRRIRVAVLGFRDDLADELATLRRRIAQRTAILDGDVQLIDLAREAVPDVDLRVVLLGSRHCGRLDLVHDLLAAATREPASSTTLVGAINVHLRQVPAAYKAEAKEVLSLDAPITADLASAVIDQLDDQLATWYAARFPSRPGMSIARERWEERYLQDKAPLWRKGDPSALRTLGGARADRVRWYVHLKAERPWVEVQGEVRLEKTAAVEMVRLRDNGKSKVGLQREGWPALPAVLWWWHDALPDRDELRKYPALAYSSALLRPAFRHHEATAQQPWLDPVLSHALLPRCVVVGPAGTGKTVLLQHLAWVLATEEAPGNASEPVHRVDRAGVRGDCPVPPIPVLHTATTLIDHLRGRPIREALVALLRSSDTFGDDTDAETVRAGIDTGRYVFLIDSLDEVPRRQDREALVAALGTLTGPAPRVIPTTRPSAHTAVELPEGFVRVDIAPLDEDTVLRLTRAWLACWAPGENLDTVLLAIAAIRYNFPAQTDERSPVENPLLLSCILQVYAMYRRLPDDTAKLYGDMVRVLCEAKIRAADDRDRDTMVERYREALRELSLASQELGGTRLAVDAAHELLVARGFATRGTADSWLQSLANHTGLVRFEGAGEHAVIRPWHRSYQEYLAAEAIALIYANRAADCVAWLREPRFERGARLDDPAWRGTVRFLIGAAVHQHRAWGVSLIDALAAVAGTRAPDQARLCAVAVKGAAEYAGTLFQNEPLRRALPHTVVNAFAIDGADWPILDRIDVLDALGRLGDPRLPDPRERGRSARDLGWVEVPPGTYKTGARPAVVQDPTGIRGKGAWKKLPRHTVLGDRDHIPIDGDPAVPAQSRSQQLLDPVPNDRLARSGHARAQRVQKKIAAVHTPLPPSTRNSAGFWIRRWPVTVAEFLPFAEQRPDVVKKFFDKAGKRLLGDAAWSQWADSWLAQARSPSRPIVEVNWYVARAFCAWAQLHWCLPCNGVIDLPTATEWEIAARRNTDRLCPWGDASPHTGERAAAIYIRDNAFVGTTPVGAFPRGHTPEGIWDMAGNVFEWCASRFPGAVEDDLRIGGDGDIGSGEVVYRGGSWARGPDALAISYRGDHPPGLFRSDVGFRVICRPAIRRRSRKTSG
ncbi:MAG: TIR domain-containing protein [Deltaproteobacteria bacterium]|nr:MAG: TIR domain-containing protein [Deltaproteobacteria bacterium]